MSDLVISVHVPKSAGSSLQQSLRSAYGEPAFLRIDDSPLDTSAQFHSDRATYLAKARDQVLPPSIRVVHGHFPAVRFAHLERAFRITFLRDPIDRLLSHYFFWRESPQQGHSLLDRFREEGMTIIDFAQIPLIANVYNGVFFVDADIEQFEFVGDFSRFSGDVSRLAEKLGTILETPRLRQNPNSAYQAEVARVKADPSMMTELKRLLAADIEFYERATSS